MNMVEEKVVTFEFDKDNPKTLSTPSSQKGCG
jgi:hypothetical protein